MMDGKDTVRLDGGLEEEARHKVKNKLGFSSSANLFDSRELAVYETGKWIL